MLPERIGRYEIRSIAGSGGFSTVYEGFDPRLDARVAIKVLADNWSNDPEWRRRFRQEAVLLRRLQSEQGVPGLVDIFDIDQSETGQPFFVMGWADRGTLHDRAKGRTWTLNDLLPVVYSITESLGHLHARGVVHRDIKPQNLLLRSDRSDGDTSGELINAGERLVLGDFGLAKDLVNGVSMLSLAGGTERYMAPEQLDYSTTVDHRADIFAATVMIAELLGADHADGATVAISPRVQAVLAKGAAFDRADRFADMAQWRDALVLAAAESAAAEQPAAPIEPAVVMTSSALAEAAATDRSRVGTVSLRALAIAVVATVAAGALAAAVLLRGGGPTIVGPSEIVSGDTVTFQVDDQDPSNVIWTDPTGQPIRSDALEVTGRLPGTLEIGVTVDGETTTREITVGPSNDGPQILGPAIVRRGEQGIFTAAVPAGQTFYWIHPVRGVVNDEQLPVTQLGEQFIVALIAVDASGVERGQQIVVTDR